MSTAVKVIMKYTISKNWNKSNEYTIFLLSRAKYSNDIFEWSFDF